MSKPEVIKIDEVEYVRCDSIHDSIVEPRGDIKIVVVDRGFVYIGYVEFSDNFVTIKNAFNIRVWGTSKGLGELVDGPTSSTKLDKVGTVLVPRLALISLINVRKSKWASLI
mgnify:CR=1 FL=1